MKWQQMRLYTLQLYTDNTCNDITFNFYAMKVEQPPQRSPGNESGPVDWRFMRLCAKKKSTRKWRLWRWYTRKTLFRLQNKHHGCIAVALLVLLNMMNVMLGTFLTKKKLFPMPDWIQSMMRTLKWRLLSRCFLRNILSNPTETSCHSYSVQCNQMIDNGKVFCRTTLLLGHLESKVDWIQSKGWQDIRNFDRVKL